MAWIYALRVRRSALSRQRVPAATGDAVRAAKRLGRADPSVTLEMCGHVLDHRGGDVSTAFAELRAAARQQAATDVVAAYLGRRVRDVAWQGR